MRTGTPGPGADDKVRGLPASMRPGPARCGPELVLDDERVGRAEASMRPARCGPELGATYNLMTGLFQLQ